MLGNYISNYTTDKEKATLEVMVIVWALVLVVAFIIYFLQLGEPKLHPRRELKITLARYMRLWRDLKFYFAVKFDWVKHDHRTIMETSLTYGPRKGVELAHAFYDTLNEHSFRFGVIAKYRDSKNKIAEVLCTPGKPLPDVVRVDNLISFIDLDRRQRRLSQGKTNKVKGYRRKKIGG